mmetsp:Transcript_14638/g.41846  ORF Transcript_14638/g.41846 Transcript_14638/m.41846 type:complete len:235 (+) Transcript_14638:425-1129(+)
MMAMSSLLPSVRAWAARRSAAMPAGAPQSRTSAQQASSPTTSHSPSEARTTNSTSWRGRGAPTCGWHANPSASRSKLPKPRVIGRTPPSIPHSMLPPEALRRATSWGALVVWSTLRRRTPPPRSPATARESPALQHHRWPPEAATRRAVLPPTRPSCRATSWHSRSAQLSASPGHAGHSGLRHTRPGTALDAWPATSRSRCPSKTAQRTSPPPRQSIERRSWLFDPCHSAKPQG